MNQDKKTLKIKALIFSVLRAKTQNLQTFSIFPGLELTFESLGTSLINLFGKLAPAKIRKEFKDYDIGPKSFDAISLSAMHFDISGNSRDLSWECNLALLKRAMGIINQDESTTKPLPR